MSFYSSNIISLGWNYEDLPRGHCIDKEDSQRSKENVCLLNSCNIISLGWNYEDLSRGHIDKEDSQMNRENVRL